jgi:hypothetical protein
VRVAGLIGLLLAGATLTVFLDSTWGLVLGIASLLAFVTASFAPLANLPEHNG